jgi:transcriptional regulator with XRE-family HTH domain
MSVHEKIRFIRQAKGFSQDEMAEKLGMCLNAYGNLERGDSEIKLIRLEQIAETFGMSLLDLFGVDEKNVLNIAGTNNTGLQNQSCTITYPTDYLQIKVELEKQIIFNTQKDKEIAMRQREIELLKKQIMQLEEICAMLKKSG